MNVDNTHSILYTHFFCEISNHETWSWIVKWWLWLIVFRSSSTTILPVYAKSTCFWHLTFIKVCHSSAFQTISRKSVNIKIINHSDSISANLNNTIQTKQHAMKKPHSNSNRNKIYKGLFFVVEGFWAENVQNLQFLLIQ